MATTPMTAAAQGDQPFAVPVLEAKLEKIEKALRKGLATGSIKAAARALKDDIVSCLTSFNINN